MADMRVVTVCGSSRFRDFIHKLCDDLTEADFIVLKPPLYEMKSLEPLPGVQSDLVWKGATLAHLQRIATADWCLFINPGRLRRVEHNAGARRRKGSAQAGDKV
jgi:hypothetical protein